MQTQALKDLAPAVDNPWVDITWEQPYAKCDEEVVLNPSYRDKFQIEGTLPEPFTGGIRSNVVCLNGNPGDIDAKCTDLEVFLMRQGLLSIIQPIILCGCPTDWEKQNIQGANGGKIRQKNYE